MLGPREVLLVVGVIQVWGWLQFVHTCVQRRNKNKEIRFGDLSLSLLPLYPILYLVIGGEEQGWGGVLKGGKKKP